MKKRLRTSLLTVGAAAMAAVLGFTAAAVGQTTTGPKGPEFKRASCTTDSLGICTVKHGLGVVPTAVLVSPDTPAPFYSYNLNTVNGSYTATTFKVRAMFAPQQPKKNGTIWFTYAAYAEGVTPPPPPPPPTTTTVVPPPTTTQPPPTTTQPPPTTTKPPVTSTTTPPPPSNKCADGSTPDLLTEGEGGDWPPYYVHNNAWNWNEGTQREDVFVCNYNSWWANIWGFRSPEGEVFMYPNVHKDIPDWHLTGKPLSTWPNAITGKFAGTVSNWNGGSYNVAWDLWLNGTGDGYELMVWTQTHNADPWGTKRGTYTDASTGKVYDVWWDGDKYLAFISQTTQTSGTVDLKAMINYSISKGYIPANPVLNQLDYGIEVRDSGTATQSSPARFTVTDFGLTMN